MLDVSTCLFVCICWLSESYPPKRERETSSKRKERAILLRHRGLNLDCGLIPSPISLWFSQSLTCNFPSVNLLKSPLMSLSHRFSQSNTIEFSDKHEQCCTKYEMYLWGTSGYLSNDTFSDQLAHFHRDDHIWPSVAHI